MRLRHIIEAQQFTVPLIHELFSRSRGMERVVERGGSLDYQKRIMATLFYQASTRTRFSFEAAMIRLGGRVLSTENARAFSSEIGAEQVEDTIRMISGYSDVIVIRHPEEGGARRASEVSSVPVINAGDGGGGQHPTQALLDLYTIYRERPLDGLSIAFIGELHNGRTIRSLAYLLAKFDRVRLYFVSPAELRMREDILAYLDRHNVQFAVETDMRKVLGEADVVYQTHIYSEHLPGKPALSCYTIDASALQLMKPDAMLLHPFPRGRELDRSVDADPRARYFLEAKNGLYVRMALLTMLLD
jgi:aspartate carbamoyltransferase catalytic subunit